MESWSYASEGKGDSNFFSHEVDFPVDMFSTSGKPVGEWDRESIDSLEFVELSFHDVLKSPCYGGSEVGLDSRIFSNSSFDSGANHSSSPVESNSLDSSLIDFDLGRLADCLDAQNDANFSQKRALLDFDDPALQVKRARIMAPLCQVYGCNKDLTPLKDYHKRHKVCEVHTKTPRVIVNGIEQRFCQQCSRFHLLSEFDDGKRSCRKRLAGHNERRRKPQFGGLSGNAYELLQQYQDTRFPETPLPKRASFLFPDMLPHSNIHPESNFYCHGSLEKKSCCNPQSALPVSNDQWLTRTPFSYHGNGMMRCESGVSHPDYFISSFIHELAKSSHGSRALSLLSDASKQYYNHGPVGCSSAKLFPSAFGKCEFCSCRMNPTLVKHNGSMPGSDHAAEFHRRRNGHFPAHLWDSDAPDSKRNCLSPENERTVDLLQLSSHLQRVEQQRSLVQMKNETEDLFDFLAAQGLRV